MDHDSKMNVARRIAAKLIEVYGENILAVLLDGSVARRDDTEYSDLEIRAITSEEIRTKEMSEDGYAQWVYKDLAILLEFRTKQEVMTMIQKPTFHWPIQVWSYIEPVVVGGSTHRVKETLAEFRQAFDSLNKKGFDGGIDWALTWTWMAYNKVRNGIIRQKPCLVIEAAHHLADTAARLVSLINGRYYRYSDCRQLENIGEFERTPYRFAELYETLFYSRSIDELGLVAKAMWETCLEFAGQEGYSMTTYNQLEDVYKSAGLAT